VYADEKGLVWPKSVAPFAVHLIAIADGEGKVMAAAEKLYEMLTASTTSTMGTIVDVLFDDRLVGVGSKLTDADLIGIPTRIVIGAKTLAEGNVEIVDRKSGETDIVALAEVLAYFS